MEHLSARSQTSSPHTCAPVWPHPIASATKPGSDEGQVPIWVQHPESTLRYWVDGVMLPAALNAAGLVDHVTGLVTSQTSDSRGLWVRDAGSTLESGIRWGARWAAGHDPMTCALDALGPVLGAAMQHARNIASPLRGLLPWRVVMLAAASLHGLADRADRVELLRRPEPTISWMPASTLGAVG